MGTTEVVINSKTDNKITLVSYEICIAIYKEVCITFCFLRIFGDFYVFLMKNITFLRDICFVCIINEWCWNIIMSVYMMYIL